jgi:hypothetical protein
MAQWIGYEKIWNYTGIPESKIRQAISTLIEHGFVHVDRDKIPEEKKNHPNRYEISASEECKTATQGTLTLPDMRNCDFRTGSSSKLAWFLAG